MESANPPRTPPPSPDPSYNVPSPPQDWPYTTRFFPSWNPRPGYNPLNDPLQNRYFDPNTWGDGEFDWDEAGWSVDCEEPNLEGSWGSSL